MHVTIVARTNVLLNNSNCFLFLIINKAAIAKLNADSSTVGSVDYKIAQAVANIEASIDTITVPDIEGLFK